MISKISAILTLAAFVAIVAAAPQTDAPGANADSAAALAARYAALKVSTSTPRKGARRIPWHEAQGVSAAAGLS
jgi:hypothetical protein